MTELKTNEVVCIKGVLYMVTNKFQRKGIDFFVLAKDSRGCADE